MTLQADIIDILLRLEMLSQWTSKDLEPAANMIINLFKEHSYVSKEEVEKIIDSMIKNTIETEDVTMCVNNVAERRALRRVKEMLK